MTKNKDDIDQLIRTNEKQKEIRNMFVHLLLIGLILIISSHFLPEQLGGILRDLGFLLTPVSMLTLYFQYYGEQDYIKRILTEVKVQMSPEIKRQSCPRDLWIGNVYPDRDSAELNEFFKSANTNIDILTTNLSWLSGPSLNILKEKANKKIPIRILALSADSPFIPMRYNDIGSDDSEHFKKEISTAIESFQMEINTLSGEYLFSWDKIPGNDNGNLIEYLMRNFGIEWIKAAKIKKNDGDKTIMVKSETNYLSLTLNEAKTNVNLEIDDGRIDKFIVKTEHNALNIYSDDNRKYFEMKIFNKCPSIIIFRVDQQLILSFILTTGKARNQPHIKINLICDSGKKSDAYRFVDHFNKLWK